MDEKRFDRFTSALAEDGGTRRTVLGVAGGGLAALFGGILGGGPFGAIDAEAKKRRRRRRRRKKQQALATQNNRDNGVTINEGDTNLFAADFDLGDATLEQVLDALGLENDTDGLNTLTNLIGADAVTSLTTGGGILCNTADITILSLCETALCDEATNQCVTCPDTKICGEGNSDLLSGTVCCIEGFVCADIGCVSENVLG